MAQHQNRVIFSPVGRLLGILIIVGVGAACNRGAATPRVADLEIDAMFAEWNTPDSAGCGVGVNRSGTMVFERGYGMANLEQHRPITPATLFDPASIAKPFTALSVMLLAEEGKLSLDDEVRKHVPEWANRRDRVTIRHLLAHTAGLRDAFRLIELAPPAAPGVDINEHILRALAGQRGVNFVPSTEFSYNNGGYNLLGTIVARVSGQSFREFVAARIFGPLGMTQSSFRGGPVAISPQHSLGYHRDDRRFHLARDGGIDTSAANADLNVTYTLVARASGLVVQIPGRAEIALQPVFPDAFYGSLVDLIKFSRRGGPRAAFTLNRTSARNLRFDRVQ